VSEVAIIGAGSSGVTVAKSLRQAGVAFDMFEKGSQLGGMWRYGNDNGQSSCYASLHIDTSRQNLGYSDFPIPPHYPDYLSHAQLLDYLTAYAEWAGIGPQVAFRTSVEAVEPVGGERWSLRLSNGETRLYRHVVIANGHLSEPRMAEFPGRLAGAVIHSHHYRDASPYEGKHVTVVGIGNSAVDIAVDLSRRARSVTLSTRRSAWIMPKYIIGWPTDRWSRVLTRKLGLPTPLARRIMGLLGRLALGDQRRFGIRRPEHPIWKEHATISQELLPAIGHGRITVKPNIARYDGDHLAFEDGSRTPCDAVILATGYRTRFPFLSPEVFDPERLPLRLYRRMVLEDQPGLIFAGLVQPIGPTIPLVEAQGRWIAALLSGQMALADAHTRAREIDAHVETQRRTWLDTPRYALEVDYATVVQQMRRDIGAGRSGA
jgi:hypothetical protein